MRFSEPISVKAQKRFMGAALLCPAVAPSPACQVGAQIESGEVIEAFLGVTDGLPKPEVEAPRLCRL